MRGTPVYTYDPVKRRRVLAGVLTDGVLHCYRTSLQNPYVRKYGGYGLAEDVLRQVAARGCRVVRIYVDGTLALEAPVEEWLRAPLDDLGHGPQRFLGHGWRT